MLGKFSDIWLVPMRLVTTKAKRGPASTPGTASESPDFNVAVRHDCFQHNQKVCHASKRSTTKSILGAG